jgi:hypothetical protein
MSRFRSKLLVSWLREGFDAESGMHSVWSVRLCISSPKTSKYLQRFRNYGEFRTKLRFSRLWEGFYSESHMHSVWRVKLRKVFLKRQNT